MRSRPVHRPADHAGPSHERRPEGVAPGAFPALLSVADAASYLAIGTTTFRETVAPELTPVRIGRAVRYARKDLDAWVAKRQATPRTATSTEPLSPRAREILALLRPPPRQ